MGRVPHLIRKSPLGQGDSAGPVVPFLTEYFTPQVFSPIETCVLSASYPRRAGLSPTASRLTFHDVLAASQVEEFWKSWPDVSK